MKQSVVRSIVLLLVAMVWGAPSFGQEAPTPRGEIRIADLILARTSVTDQHWSVRKHKADI
jgi:hypothetical protein